MARSVVDIHYVRFPQRRLWDPICQWLSPAELDRARRFRFERDRYRFGFSQAYLRWVLATQLKIEPADVQFEVQLGGKPVLAQHLSRINPAVAGFNLSRCQSFAAVAVGPTPWIGVDVEDNSRVDGMGIASRQFCDQEYQHLISQPVEMQANAFLKLWACKEAAVKAVGKGLALPLDSFSICQSQDGSTSLEFQDAEYGRPDQWSLFVRQIEFNCYLAVAIRLSSVDIVWRETVDDLPWQSE